MQVTTFPFAFTAAQLMLIGDALLDMMGGPDQPAWPLAREIHQPDGVLIQVFFEGPKHREICLSIAPQVWKKCHRAHGSLVASQQQAARIRLYAYEVSLIALAIRQYPDLPPVAEPDARAILAQVEPRLMAG